MIGFAWLRKFIKDTTNEIDLDNDMPSDFSIWIEGLPKDEPTHKIKKYFEDYGTGNPEFPTEISRIFISYQVSEFIKTLGEFSREKKKLQSLYHNDIQKVKEKLGAEYEHYQHKEEDFSEKYKTQLKVVEKHQNELRDVTKKIKDENCAAEYRTGIYIISFSTKRKLDKVVDLWTNLEGIGFSRLISNKSDKVYERISSDGKKTEIPIWVMQAPEPSDIIWENLGFSLWFLLRRRIITFVSTSILLLFCFIIVLFLKVVQRGMSNNDDDAGASLPTRAISIVISIVISVVNAALTILIRKFTVMEKHFTITEFNSSLTVKIAISQFANTCLQVVLVHIVLFEPDWVIWAKGALLTDAWFIIFIDAILTPLLYVFNPGHIIKKIKQKMIGKNSKMTQEDAHLLFEGIQIDPAEIHAKIIKLFFSTLFFFPLLPVSALLTCISLFLIYWALKYVLLRMAQRPVSLSASITITSVWLLNWGTAIIAVIFFVKKVE